MSLLDGLRVAFDALTAHLLRTVLAMLGLIIGVGAVITLLAVGRGSQDDVARNIQSLGTNLITVRPAAFQQGVVRSAAGARPTLTYEDVQALARYVLPHRVWLGPHAASHGLTSEAVVQDIIDRVPIP
mgnify:CR=1 FL=1